jgi:hypothetical protein
MPVGVRALLAFGLLLALGVSMRSAAAAPGDEGACRESFQRFQGAFESRSADSVVACMAPEGTLSIALLGVAGRGEPMKKEQAQKVLKGYFEQVSAAKLKAREGQAPDALVRAYDYTRRLRSGDPTTTRLTVTLKKDAAGALRLHALSESAR